MKSGKKFDENALTVAVRPTDWKSLRGKKLRVTNPETGKSVDVEVTDTGGFKKYGRVLDLSLGAFKRIADPKRGVVNVRYEVIDESKVADAVKEKRDGRSR